MKWLLCPAPKCPRRIQVSSQDPDSTLTEMGVHLRGWHPELDAEALLLQTTMEDDGRG